MHMYFSVSAIINSNYIKNKKFKTVIQLFNLRKKKPKSLN